MKALLILLICFGFVWANVWVIELHEGINPDEFAQEHGLRYQRHFRNQLHVFESANPRARDHFDAVENVKWAELQIPKQQHKRERVPKTGSSRDPYWAQQWHLHGYEFASVDLDPAQVMKTGRGIVIGIVDDGLQHTHPEIHNNYLQQYSYDFNGRDGDPMPSQQDGHGTSAAAVAMGIRGNGHCGQGAAPEAKIAGIRAIAGPVSDLEEAEALSLHANHIDIYSCSWGPADTGDDMVRPGRLVQETLEIYAGQKHGRNGKGNIYMWAAGNGRAYDDSCAYDGYAGSPYVNAIGAIDVTGDQSWYSEGCSNLMAVAPSSGASRGITTADLLGRAGYDSGECTHSFGGTSSAAPLAAGVAALILEQRPDLTWRDVKHVIAKGAKHIRPSDASWNVNSAGYHHSNRFGFGLLKIPALLETARRHVLVPNQKSRSAPVQRLSPGLVPDNGYSCLEHSVSLHGSQIQFIEYVLVTVYIEHPRRGEVTIHLTSPSGTVSELATKHNDYHRNYPNDGWTFSSLHFWGEAQADGTWTLEVCDREPNNGYKGALKWYQINVAGY